MTQENNGVITTKKGKGKLPLFHGNREQLIPIYVESYYIYLHLHKEGDENIAS